VTSVVTWSSSSTSTAIISDTLGSYGLATSASQGMTTITATSGTVSATAALTVNGPNLISIAITPDNAALPLGESLQFDAVGTYTDGSTQDLTQTAVWASSVPTVAAVNAPGYISGLLSGSTIISASSAGINGLASVTVTMPVLVSIGVSPGSATIAKGTNQQFVATGTFSNGSTQNVTGSVTWSSSSTVAGVGSGGLASGEGVGTATITATSGTIAGSATLNVGQAVLVSIAVTPANGSFALGTTLPLVATGTYSDGSTLVLTTTATWSTSNSGIATVNGQGVASSAGVGNTTVTAAVGAVSGTTTVTVNPAVLVSIAVTPAIPTIPMGTTQQFTATGSFTDGSTQNLTGTVQWSSDTPAVGLMSTTTPGLLSSEGTGTANITATSGSVSGATQLTVTTAALVSIAVTPGEASIALGTSQQFTATGTFTDGSTQNLTGMVTWSTDTPGTGTISNTVPTQGLATSVGTGAANITASSGTISGTAQLAVTAAALVSIAINPPTASIPLGTTQQFTATGSYTDGTTQDLTQNGQWTSTAATVATISDTPGTMGLASPLTTGTTTIGISSGGVSATASLVVNPAALVSIAINPPAASIALGTTQQFTATGTYTDHSTQDVTSVVTWSSSSTSTAIISDTLGSYGLATSASQGMTTITATSGAVSATAALTVNGPNLISIAITPGNAALPLGESLQFDAVGTYTDGSTQDLTQTAVWASSVPTVAAVNAPGSVTGLLSGSTVISASSGSVTGSATLVVNPAVPVSLVLTPALASILTGTQQQFTAILNYSNGSTVNVSTSVAWSSVNYSIASVNSAGLAAGVTNGSTTIQATWGGNVFTAGASITVSAPVPKTWYVSPAGSDANNCLSGTTPCFTLAQAESLSAAGDTITLAAGTYRLSPGGSSTAGQIAPKSNQTFIGPSCTPTSAACSAVISGGISIGGFAQGPDSLGNWYVTGQTQQGTVNTSASCDSGWGACIYPEDLFFNGVPLQHVVASSEPALAANQWWFDYTNHIIYFSQNPAGNTVEASVLETAFSTNGANNVTIENLTVQEFASPVQRGAVDPAFSGSPTNSAGLNWTIENSYITLNHGYGVRGAFGMQVLNSVLTNNGNFGLGGGIQAGASINPSGLVVQGNTVSYNNYAHVSPDFGAGGMKFGNTAYATIRGNTVTNNLGNGIHFDEDSLFPLIDGNTVTGNGDSLASGGEAGISFEIGFGGATVRNNIVRHNGDTASAGPAIQISSGTSVGMQAYCNVIETGANVHESAFEVTSGERGYNTEQPYLGTYLVSTGNYVHHNTVIWDTGSTASAGYLQGDPTNQPNFFSLNTPPNYNQYHASNVNQSVFIYGDVNGNNKAENFPTYQSLGADVNSTIDSLYSSGYPTVSITSPPDQSSVSNGFSVAASASDPLGISRVEFFVDWSLAGTVTGSPYNFSVGALSGGPHTIAAMAFNGAGIQSCYAITVYD
jgi:parallel beta-helix repeat protein